MKARHLLAKGLAILVGLKEAPGNVFKRVRVARAVDEVADGEEHLGAQAACDLREIRIGNAPLPATRQRQAKPSVGLRRMPCSFVDLTINPARVSFGGDGLPRPFQEQESKKLRNAFVNL
jgi:hypothetical protein